MIQSWEQQFLDVNNSMVLSTPEQYGDFSWIMSPIGLVFTDYPDNQGNMQTLADGKVHVYRPEDRGLQSMAPGSYQMTSLQWQIDHSESGTAAREAADRNMAAELNRRQQVDRLFQQFAARAFHTADLKFEPSSFDELMRTPSSPIIHTACMRRVDEAIRSHCGGYTDYSRKYAGLVINTCRVMGQAAEPAEASLPALMADLCRSQPTITRAEK